MVRSFRRLSGAVVLLSGVGMGTQLHASGFALIENSASGQGNAFAGASAIGEDASTVWFNPAAMTRIRQPQVVIAGHYILPKADFTNTGSTQSAVIGGAPLTGRNSGGGREAIVPNSYYVHPVSDTLTLGFGINSPFGLKTHYDDDWVGRYHAVETDLKTVNLNPSFALKITDQFSFGFGFNLQLADVTLSQAVDMGAICEHSLGVAGCAAIGGPTPGTADGFAKLTGDNFNDLSWGYNLGILYEYSTRTRWGLAYRSSIYHKVEGDADFSIPAAGAFAFASGGLIDTTLTAEVELPHSLSLSVYHDYNDKLAVLADLTRTYWSTFQELRIKYDNPAQPDTVNTEEWKNTWRVSLGANYRLNKQWMLRGGLAYDQTPIPSPQRRTARIPGTDRRWVSLGVSHEIDDDMGIDVGYSHLFISDSLIANELEGSTTPTLNGTYSGSVDILSAQLRWNI